MSFAATTERSKYLLPVLLACASLTVMAGATIAPGLPGLLSHFSEHPDAEYLTLLILSIPGLAIAISAPIAGYLADKFGRRVLLQFGVALYVIAGTGGLWLSDIHLLLFSRLMLGVAVGAVMVCSMALLTDHFQGAERDRVMGIQSSAMAAGGIIFIFAGSLLADVSWRAPFVVYLFPIVLFPLIYKFVTKPASKLREPEAVDGQFPMRHAALIYGVGFVTMLVFYLIPTQLPFLAIELGAQNFKYAGFAIVVSQIFASVASANYQRLKSYFTNQQILLFSFVSMSLGFFALSQINTLVGMFLCMPLIGVGLGFNFPNMSIWLMSRVPATMRGRASGGLTTSIFLGQFMSPFLSVPLVQMFGLSGSFFGTTLIMICLVVLPSALMVAQGKR
jgi:MFS family permease